MNKMDKIICVGKNYPEHIQEMGDAVPERPVLFLKPPSSCIQAQSFGDTLIVPLPQGRSPAHYECEIVLRLAQLPKSIPLATLKDALHYVTGVSLGLDMTIRDEQKTLKKNGHPWEVSKVFTGSALVGPWIEGAEIESILSQEFQFSLNEKICQRGLSKDMIFSVPECVNHARYYFPILDGDLLFTGTPAGVGPVAPGQVGSLQWNGRTIMRVKWE